MNDKHDNPKDFPLGMDDVLNNYSDVLGTLGYVNALASDALESDFITRFGYLKVLNQILHITNQELGYDDE